MIPYRTRAANSYETDSCKHVESFRLERRKHLSERTGIYPRALDGRRKSTKPRAVFGAVLQRLTELLGPKVCMPGFGSISRSRLTKSFYF